MDTRSRDLFKLSPLAIAAAMTTVGRIFLAGFPQSQQPTRHRSRRVNDTALEQIALQTICAKAIRCKEITRFPVCIPLIV